MATYNLEYRYISIYSYVLKIMHVQGLNYLEKYENTINRLLIMIYLDRTSVCLENRNYILLNSNSTKQTLTSENHNYCIKIVKMFPKSVIITSQSLRLNFVRKTKHAGCTFYSKTSQRVKS